MSQEQNKFGVDLDALADAEKGVEKVVSELREMLGWGSGHLAEQGVGLLNGVSLDASTEVGHEGLGEALRTFGGKWQWGLRHLVDDGAGAAEALGDTRSTYEKVEDAVNGTLKGIVGTAVGDPSTSTTAWQDRSWGQIGSGLVPGSTTFEMLQGSDNNGDGEVG
ncbi:hypothetical protein ACOQFL_14315 [Actinopolyspora sp. H202]|uniref:hypothetical protein n=1 Tax=Actinopolyspora sp. H202 TaxID=1500456 RepID=UPI003EE45312